MTRKHCVLVLLLLTVNFSSFACGFYPYGDDVRFCFLKPKMVFPKSNDWFFYSNRDYYNRDFDFDSYSKEQLLENTVLWATTYNGQFSNDDIYEAVYKASAAQLKNAKDSNPFIQELNKKEHLADRDYLLFAKTVAAYNYNVNDDWEEESASDIKKRKKYVSKALKLAKSTPTEMLKRRYAHLALRLAFYAEDENKVRSIYNDYFDVPEFRDAIDCWALSFKLQFDDYSVERSIAAARVFLYSSEKRFSVHEFFGLNIPLDEILQQTKNTEEAIAVHYTAACLNDGHALDRIESIAKLNPSHPCLEFLTLREVNKFEDWVLTTQYTYFDLWDYYYYEDSYNPSISSQLESIEAGLVSNRKNAGYLVDIMEKYQLKMNHEQLYRQYLRFIARDFTGLSTEIKKDVTTDKANDRISLFRKRLYTLTRIANDEDPNLEDKLVQETLLSSDYNSQFYLAVGRELERHGHKSLAALVLSKVNQQPDTDDDERYYGAFWKTPKHHRSLESDYYYEYFTYIDVMYSPSDIQGLIFYLDNEPETSEFDKWLCKDVRKERTRLFDLLGTMYMRKNDLNSALSAFEQVDDTLWTSEHYAYKTYIHDDPFNNDFYWKTDYRHLDEVKQKYTKPEIIKELLKQLELVKNSTGNKKAKAAYRVANCYRNMSFYGNAWMMRRYFWTISANETGLEDDEEYFHCKQAQKYYKIAFEHASSKDFKMLALRMQGLCVEYDMSYDINPYYMSYEETQAVNKLNPCYKQLRKEYGGDYEWSNCDRYQTYFETIK